MVKTVLKIALEKGFIKFFAPTDKVVRQSLQCELKKCLERYNGYVCLSFCTPKRLRSTGKESQNHHLNGHIQAIAKESGNDFETTKLAVKDIAIDLGYPFRTIFYPLYDVKNDEEIRIGLVKKRFVLKNKVFEFWCKEMRIAKSESECTTEECALLIEASHILAATNQIILKE